MREKGFYWVKTNIRNYVEGWSIGFYDPAARKYPWEVIGSDNIYDDTNILEVGEKIPQIKK